eukprot:355358-Chlamydomonas_euryale.AAC.2
MQVCTAQGPASPTTPLPGGQGLPRMSGARSNGGCGDAGEAGGGGEEREERRVEYGEPGLWNSVRLRTSKEAALG